MTKRAATIVLPREQADALAAYLAGRPYREVAYGVQWLYQAAARADAAENEGAEERWKKRQAVRQAEAAENGADG